MGSGEGGSNIWVGEGLRGDGEQDNRLGMTGEAAGRRQIELSVRITTQKLLFLLRWDTSDNGIIVKNSRCL